MRITKNLHPDQDTIDRFLAVFGSGSSMLGHSKLARPGFFVVAYNFIHEYIECNFFKKEELLMKALEEVGFSPDEGPVGLMHTEQKKSQETAQVLINASKGWQAGDEEARTEVAWASSEYISILRPHLDRLKNLIFPLLEQNLSEEDEHKIAEGFNNILFENPIEAAPDKYIEVDRIAGR